MSRCSECNHQSDGSSHDKCRTHADCVRDRKYYAAFCGICHGLWARAREFRTNLTDATAAFDLLCPWVVGFGKNSKGRARGEDFFVDVEERREFKYLSSILRPRKRASSVDSSHSSIPSHRVSVTDYFMCLSFLFAYTLSQNYKFLHMLMSGPLFLSYRGPSQWTNLGPS